MAGERDRFQRPKGSVPALYLRTVHEGKMLPLGLLKGARMYSD